MAGKPYWAICPCGTLTEVHDGLWNIHQKASRGWDIVGGWPVKEIVVKTPCERSGTRHEIP